MNCVEAQPLIHAYLDGELDLRGSLEVEGHLARCAACSERAAVHRELRARTADPSLRFASPPGLTERLARKIDEALALEDGESSEPSNDSKEAASIGSGPRLSLTDAASPKRDVGVRAAGARRWLAVAAMLLLSVGAAWIVASLVLPPMHEEGVGREVLDSHIRSLMADHLTDVMSSDKHTVKPWFNGKTDFSPPVVDLADQGFALAGGRLDYIDGHVVAGLAYRRQKHVVNLFLWPSGRADSEPGVSTRNGYNVLHWHSAGMECWGVSDLNVAEMEEWAGKLNARIRGAAK